MAKSSTAAIGQVNHGQTVSQRGSGGAASMVNVDGDRDLSRTSVHSTRTSQDPAAGRSTIAARRSLLVAASVVAAARIGECDLSSETEFDDDGGVGDGLASDRVLDEHADVDRAGAERVGRREDGHLIVVVRSASRGPGRHRQCHAQPGPARNATTTTSWITTSSMSRCNSLNLARQRQRTAHLHRLEHDPDAEHEQHHDERGPGGERF